MKIHFKCPECQKPLAVKEELAGKRAACPACKKPILIPAPIAPPADIEAFAAAALAEQAAPTAAEEAANKPIEFTCAYCDEVVQVAADLAGKNTQCPSCRQIVKVPVPKVEKPKDWRNINKDGPAAARINLPEQLEGAWGTEAKSRVGRESLEEAGAIVEPPAKPIGVGGWIRRVTKLAAGVGAIVLLFLAVNRGRTLKHEKNVIVEAREYAKSVEGDPKKKLHPILMAEIEKAEGILLLRQGKREPARQQFFKARARCGEAAKDSPVDHDLFLIELALAQFDMAAGSEDQYRAGTHYEWKDVLIEVEKTLESIKSPEARVVAARVLGTELAARKQMALASTLAARLNPMAAATDKNLAPQGRAQQVALIFAYGDPKKAEEMQPQPNSAKPKPLDMATRMAYAEGHARKGQITEARKFIDATGGTVANRLEAAIGVACVVVGDTANKDGPVQAADFMTDALKVHKTQSFPPWLTYQLHWAGIRIPEHAAEARERAAKLPDNFKRRAQLDWVVARLQNGDGNASMDLVKDFPEPGGPTRGQAWIALGRHLGSAVQLPDADSDDGQYRIFAKIGMALGNQDLTK